MIYIYLGEEPEEGPYAAQAREMYRAFCEDVNERVEAGELDPNGKLDRASVIRLTWIRALPSAPEGSLDGGPGHILQIDSPIGVLTFVKAEDENCAKIVCDGVVCMRMEK